MGGLSSNCCQGLAEREVRVRMGERGSCQRRRKEGGMCFAPETDQRSGLGSEEELALCPFKADP